MNIEGTTLWQHAAGDPDHNHVELCLDWDVILIGPGDVPWPETNRDGVRKVECIQAARYDRLRIALQGRHRLGGNFYFVVAAQPRIETK